MIKLNINDYDYELPKELIAQTPLKNRSESKLLVMDKNTGELEDNVFKNIISYLNYMFKPCNCYDYDKILTKNLLIQFIKMYTYNTLQHKNIYNIYVLYLKYIGGKTNGFTYTSLFHYCR